MFDGCNAGEEKISAWVRRNRGLVIWTCFLKATSKRKASVSGRIQHPLQALKRKLSHQDKSSVISVFLLFFNVYISLAVPSLRYSMWDHLIADLGI